MKKKKEVPIHKQIDAIVAKNLRAGRISKGMSQDALGKITGVTFQQIQKYERGINRISAGRLYQFAEILEMDIPQFYDGKSPEPSKSSRHVRQFISLTAIEQAALIKIHRTIKGR